MNQLLQISTVLSTLKEKRETIKSLKEKFNQAIVSVFREKKLHNAAKLFRIVVRLTSRFSCIQSLMNPVKIETKTLAMRGTDE